MQPTFWQKKHRLDIRPVSAIIVPISLIDTEICENRVRVEKIPEFSFKLGTVQSEGINCGMFE